MKRILCCAVAVGALGMASGATALTVVRPPIVKPLPLQQAGTLTCKLAPAIGLGFGSRRQATCVFDHVGTNGFSESYAAHFSRVGIDIGYMGGQSLKLAVFTPGGEIQPGGLSGSLQGTSTQAALVMETSSAAAFTNPSRTLILQQRDSGYALGMGLGFGRSNLDLQSPSSL